MTTSPSNPGGGNGDGPDDPTQGGLFDAPDPPAEDEKPEFDDDQAHARRTDPGTSHGAAGVMEASGKASTLTKMIVHELERLGIYGMTSWEFCDLHPEAERVSVSPRFSAMKAAGETVIVGKRRRPGQVGGAASEVHALPKFHKIREPLADDDPKPNSPEDLGMVTPNAPPPEKVYGKPVPEPDPLPENFARSAIQWDDARKFRDWIYNQEDLPTHAAVTLGGIVCGLSGLGKPDLRWLCQAIRQAGTAPSPDLMRRAVLTHDVSVLRETEKDAKL